MKNKNRLFFPCAVAAAWTVVLRLDPPKYCKQNVWDQDYNTEGCLIHSSCRCTRSCSMEVKQFRWLIAPGGSWYRSVLAGNNVLAPEESLLEKGESVSWLECLFGWLILLFFFFLFVFICENHFICISAELSKALISLEGLSDLFSFLLQCKEISQWLVHWYHFLKTL